jgi:hypothetical protein
VLHATSATALASPATSISVGSASEGGFTAAAC